MFLGNHSVKRSGSKVGSVSDKYGNLYGKTILQVVVKNTSTLDYTIPLLWKLSVLPVYKRPRLAILYVVDDRSRILRDAQFINDFCFRSNVSQYDLLDFAPGIISRLVKSFSKQVGCFTISDKPIYGKALGRIERVMVKYIVSSLFSMKRVLNKISPDIIMYDNRDRSDFIGRSAFYRYVDRSDIPIVLLPHAPHYINQSSDEYIQYDEHRIGYLPVNAEYWRPFKFGVPWLQCPELKKSFIDIGYPAFDEEWADHVMNRFQEERNEKYFVIMVLVRKFLKKNQSRREHDVFEMDYSDVLDYINLINKAVNETGECARFIIKPHPSCNSASIDNLLIESDLDNYTVTYDSYFSSLSDVDCVVGNFTTSLLLPVRYGIPTIIIDSDLQGYVHRSWPLLSELYCGFPLYLTVDEDGCLLSDLIKKIMFDKGFVSNVLMKSKKHLENYFTFNSIEIAMNRIEYLVRPGSGI